jgi:thymidylate synthase ThyX
MKACEHPTCSYPVFSHRFCGAHQKLRTDEKYLKAQRKAQEKRYSSRKKIVRDMSFGFKGEAEMFESIWQDRLHVCEFTGERLDKFYGTDLWFSCFMHILPKGQFPLWRLNPENVRLGAPDFHTILHNGTMADRLKHPSWAFNRWDKLVQEMKGEYLQFKKDNLIG